MVKTKNSKSKSKNTFIQRRNDTDMDQAITDTLFWASKHSVNI